MSIIQAFPAGAGGGTSDYTDLENKPQIAGVTLSGNKTLSELGIQPAEAGKGLSTEDYTTAEKTKLDNINLSNYVPNSEVGSAGGVAELDANGKVPVSQMPNGFDNIDNGTAGGVTSTVNGYTAESFTRTGESSPVTPADDTLYVDTTLNVAFRWTGSQYISVGGGGVALGETSSTAYRGDRGKIAYDDSQANKSAIGTLSNLNTTEKTNLVGAINEVRGIATSKEDKFRYSTMPEASVDYVGKIVDYIGSTTASYTKGKSYECKAQGTNPETYAWDELKGDGVKDERISDEITGMRIEVIDGKFRCFASVDLSKLIINFNDMTPELLSIYAGLYYEGKITLEQLQEYWSIGDSFNITLPASDITAEQIVNVILVDFNHDTLTTAQGETTKALATLGFMFDENLSTGSVPYSTSTGNTWLNETCLNLLPIEMRTSVKQVQKQVDGGWTAKYGKPITTTISTKIFIPSCPEFIGRNIKQSECNTGGASWCGASGAGTRYAYHALSNARNKNVISASSTAWLVDWNVRQVVAKTDNTATPIAVNGTSGFMPHFCI